MNEMNIDIQNYTIPMFCEKTKYFSFEITADDKSRDTTNNFHDQLISQLLSQFSNSFGQKKCQKIEQISITVSQNPRWRLQFTCLTDPKNI